MDDVFTCNNCYFASRDLFAIWSDYRIDYIPRLVSALHDRNRLSGGSGSAHGDVLSPGLKDVSPILWRMPAVDVGFQWRNRRAGKCACSGDLDVEWHKHKFTYRHGLLCIAGDTGSISQQYRMNGSPHDGSYRSA